MKLGKGILAAGLGAALNLGIVGPASADVYGVSSLAVANVTIGFNATSNAPGLFIFSTNQDAILNTVPDPASGAAACSGNFPSVGTCTGSAPLLSGTVQNAPGGGVTRAENDYQIFGQVAEFSNAEAAIETALMVGDPATSARAISESNIQSGTSAQADTNITSSTLWDFTFAVGPNGFVSIDFDAAVNVLTQVTGGDLGLAQANSGVTVLLELGGVTLASWAPTGTNSVTTCDAALTCTATESPLSLNNTSSSNGTPNQVVGSGSYQLLITGLATGTYTLALATTTSTDLARAATPPPDPPVSIPVQTPGVLFLLGCSLLLTGLGALRRRKN